MDLLHFSYKKKKGCTLVLYERTGCISVQCKIQFCMKEPNVIPFTVK